MILEKLIAKIHTWQIKTFGPGEQVKRYTDHIKSEVEEVLEDPKALDEWMDIVILALGGAARQGYNPWEIAHGLEEKLNVAMSREWPDWRDFHPDKTIHHIKEELDVT
ncbi:MAG: dATP/dGTP pyrophosphohydrolase domain-containing protein [Dehalococcoidia bacterium]